VSRVGAIDPLHTHSLSRTTDAGYGLICFLRKGLAKFALKRMSVQCVFETSVGSFTVELYNQHAPKTCHNFQGDYW